MVALAHDPGYLRANIVEALTPSGVGASTVLSALLGAGGTSRRAGGSVVSAQIWQNVRDRALDAAGGTNRGCARADAIGQESLYG